MHFADEVTFTPAEEAAVRFVDDDQARRQLLRTLTPREHEVLDLLITGAATAEIAARLSISPVTWNARPQ